ncbi:fumarate hydratase [Halothermothrix orenii]|uniref:Fumarate hydratase, alpha subunit n=1 Tax=Halothermothrix orenii (strain H 168 / OCM 544 / DSM 9562) TaxID=373903 RepID=B8CWU2_HALOH|nr:fumarate hydratase [Halothermothrix orenii]ACL69761.1 fumarate hydratase, alpha subunit [Halothermothrix orenii H 168]
MRTIEAEEITKVVKEMIKEANYYLPEDVLRFLKNNKEKEESSIGRDILKQIVKNAQIACEEKMPICQDTGLTVVFLEIGNEVHINGDIYRAVNEGVRQGSQEGYLRKSVVKSPLNRVNTGDNTPAVIHTEIVPGDRLKIIIAPKGGGSENMSTVKMLKPADGIEGIKKTVLKTVEDAGANPCPPIIVGVGLGGTFEKAALLAKKALLRPLDDSHPDKDVAALENDLLNEINKLGIGPQGLGGVTTALSVKVEVYPCHIASLPVGININCHAARHREIIL